MKPEDIAADEALLLRFQQEVAYLDRTTPTEDEARNDATLLRSEDGVLVVAWLWPDEMYFRDDFDPFEDSARRREALLAALDEMGRPVADQETLATTERGIDRRRVARVELVARRAGHVLEVTARATGRSLEDLKTHLTWAVPISRPELDRLLSGQTPFQFAAIVGICRALHLEFDTVGWRVVDPPLLARRITHSAAASEISDHLRHLTLDSLTSFARKLPREQVDPALAHEPDVYAAPAPGGRYAALYDALAADVRQDPEYTLAEIERLLVLAGEPELPPSAGARSWWAGTGAKTEGRPQVSAWWAAGYRIQEVTRDPVTDQVTSVRFEALPGRDQWLADPARVEQRTFSTHDPRKVWVYPDEDVLRAIGPAAGVVAAAMDTMLKGFAHNSSSWASSSTGVRTVLDQLKAPDPSRGPDDPDIRQLVEFLAKAGDADRAKIERHFGTMRNEPVDAQWMTALLTRARRQGWIVNEGTRTQPRWTRTQSKAELVNDIAQTLEAMPPALLPGSTVPKELFILAAEKVGVPHAGLTRTQLGRAIVESTGGTWPPESESAGGTVTVAGLKAVRDAVRAYAR